MKNYCRIVFVVLLCGAMSSLGFALTDEEIFRNFRFNLINPGARSLSLGGAFVSLADDSTAAWANPAGLMNLRRPELFAEVRASSVSSTSVTAGTPLRTKFFDGQVTAGALVDPLPTISPSFISYVIPMERFAFAFSRMESLRINTRTMNSFRITGEAAIIDFQNETGDPVIIGTALIDEERTASADMDARIDLYNLAMAVDLHRTLSFGVTLVVGVMSMDGRVDNLFSDRTAGPQDPFGSPTLDYATRIKDNDLDLSFNAGVIWRPMDALSFGAVYRRGTRFVLEETISDEGVNAERAQEIFGRRFDNVFNTPDSYGVGVSIRPSEPWTFLIDVMRIEYSDLLDGYKAGLNRITFPFTDARFTVDDATEIHVGIEYLFVVGETPIALRIGGWSDPDRRIRSADADEFGLLAVFPKGEDLVHITGGFGLTLKQSIQLDFAIDSSSETTDFVMSSIFRF